MSVSLKKRLAIVMAFLAVVMAFLWLTVGSMPYEPLSCVCATCAALLLAL